MTYCIIQSTTSSEDEAKKIAHHLIQKKLIACCSIIPNVYSVYTWEGKTNEDTEILMIMKTKTQLYSQVEKEIKRLHSYEVPEIICLNVQAGNKDYLNWISEQT